MSEIEQRVRALIEKIENIDTHSHGLADSRTHWMSCGKDEAFDDVLDWLYRDVLQEDR